jgi:hypothetical protein
MTVHVSILITMRTKIKAFLNATSFLEKKTFGGEEGMNGTGCENGKVYFFIGLRSRCWGTPV